MKTKLLTLGIGIALILILLPFFSRISAQVPPEVDIEALLEVSEKPAFLPDSPFYFLKRWGEGIRMFFTFNPEKKAEYESMLANHRLAEAKIMCEEGKTELCEKMCERYQERMKRAMERCQKQKQKGKDVEALIEKLKERSIRQQEVSANIFGRVPEEAREGLMDAMENSAKHMERVIEAMEGKEPMEQYQIERQVRIRGQVQNMGEEQQLQIQRRLRLGPPEEIEEAKPEEIERGEPGQRKRPE